MVKSIGTEPVIFAKEFTREDLYDDVTQPFYVEKSGNNEYTVYGPRIERMLGYTNLDSERGFDFFQKFMKENGIIDELINLGIEEGDTVKLCDYFEFEYYV